MQDDPFLGQVVLGHSAVIDRDYSVVATRLTMFAHRRDGLVDARWLLRRVLEVWPAPGGDGAQVQLTLRPVGTAAVAAAPPVSGAVPSEATPLVLNITSERWLRDMLVAEPPPHIMIEVPAFMACDPQHAPALQALREAGSALVIKGRPVSELPRELLSCFRHSLIDVGEDRRGSTPVPTGAVRSITHIQGGVRTRAEVDVAFARGAVAVLGWPLDDELQPKDGKGRGPDLQTVMALMQGVEREEPVERLEALLRNDPQLAFRLIRYLNSAAFGLKVEISSFRHALMMLGHKKLKRWLALLLASSSRDPAMRPAMQASVRRGLVMEELARGSSDDEMRGEMFICGVFSLLDGLVGQGFADLFKSVPVPEGVRQALVDGSGPYQPYLNLTQALESGSRTDIIEAEEACVIGHAEVNAALLRALAAARELG